jgi:steroid delta-isomerase-like uncharacterized protein
MAKRAKNLQNLFLVCVGIAVAPFGAASRETVVSAAQDPSHLIVDNGSLPVTGTVALAAGSEVSIAGTPAVTNGGLSRSVSDFRDARQNMMPTAESERNKATLRRLIDAMNTNDVEIISRTIDELFEPDVVVRNPLPLDVPGAQGLKRVFTMLHRAYPDLHITIEDVIAEGNKVVVRNSVTGTHRGEYMGIPPTGKTVTYNEIFIARFVNGRVVEAWGVVDVLAQMRQLGVIPASRRPNGE